MDQQINITYIDELCLALQKIINDKLTGIFHVASRDLTTPHELISHYISLARHLSFSAVEGKVDPARYPKYGGLDTEITQEKLGMRFSSWKEIVKKFLSTLIFGMIARQQDFRHFPTIVFFRVLCIEDTQHRHYYGILQLENLDYQVILSNRVMESTKIMAGISPPDKT